MLIWIYYAAEIVLFGAKWIVHTNALPPGSHNMARRQRALGLLLTLGAVKDKLLILPQHFENVC